MDGCTVVGSSNFSYRSQMKDMEMCFLIQTKSLELRKRIEKEKDIFKPFLLPVHNNQQSIPFWIKMATFSFLKYYL